MSRCDLRLLVPSGVRAIFYNFPTSASELLASAHFFPFLRFLCTQLSALDKMSRDGDLSITLNRSRITERRFRSRIVSSRRHLLADSDVEHSRESIATLPCIFFFKVHYRYYCTLARCIVHSARSKMLLSRSFVFRHSKARSLRGKFSRVVGTFLQTIYSLDTDRSIQASDQSI